MPKVSICIPTFNHEEFLGAAVRSAMAQSYRDLEILVMDNASEDNTPRLMAELQAQDNRIKYVRHGSNVGLIANFNACLETAVGSFIKYLCSDDVLEPECVARMVEVLENEPCVALVGCAREVTDVNLQALRRSGMRKETCHIPGPQAIADCYFLGNRIGEPSAVMFRKHDASRGFDGRHAQLIDMEMYIHLLQSGSMVFLQETLCKVRLHAGQQTWNNDRSGRIVANRRLLFREFSGLVAPFAKPPYRLLWDFRMAYAAQRAAASGAQMPATGISEVYFPWLFRWCIYPIVKVLRLGGLGRVWRSG